MVEPFNVDRLNLAIDRGRSTPITVQIATTLRNAIIEGRLRPGSRLPSWLDMAAQLGVARGTIKAAYETLADEFLVVSAGAAGTRVAEVPARKSTGVSHVDIPRPLQEFERGFSLRPLPFQIGVPAQDAFPAKLWARLRMRAVRENAISPVGPPDPRGEPELRAEVAAMLAITRGISCHPDQVVLTSGYKNGLCLTLLALQAVGRGGWVENPGRPASRLALEFAGVRPVPIPVDTQGLLVEHAIEVAPDAALAVVSPGHHAPTGVSLSPERRAALLAWAAREDGWIVEDDYLSDLQLSGRAQPPMAAGDVSGRVIYVGGFGESISPALGLGYVIAPIAIAARFAEVAGCLNPAPSTTAQLALAGFLADGHFLRHLRHMKHLYRERRDSLESRLGSRISLNAFAGLAGIAHLPRNSSDVALARRAQSLGIAPAPLSVWYADPADAPQGLVLSVTNLRKQVLAKACEALTQLIDDPERLAITAKAA